MNRPTLSVRGRTLAIRQFEVTVLERRPWWAHRVAIRRQIDVQTPGTIELAHDTRSAHIDGSASTTRARRIRVAHSA